MRRQPCSRASRTGRGASATTTGASTPSRGRRSGRSRTSTRCAMARGDLASSPSSIRPAAIPSCGTVRVAPGAGRGFVEDAPSIAPAPIRAERGAVWSAEGLLAADTRHDLRGPHRRSCLRGGSCRWPAPPAPRPSRARHQELQVRPRAPGAARSSASSAADSLQRACRRTRARCAPSSSGSSERRRRPAARCGASRGSPATTAASRRATPSWRRRRRRAAGWRAIAVGQCRRRAQTGNLLGPAAPHLFIWPGPIFALLRRAAARQRRPGRLSESESDDAPP